MFDNNNCSLSSSKKLVYFDCGVGKRSGFSCELVYCGHYGNFNVRNLIFDNHGVVVECLFDMMYGISLNRLCNLEYLYDDGNIIMSTTSFLDMSILFNSYHYKIVNDNKGHYLHLLKEWNDNVAREFKPFNDRNMLITTYKDQSLYCIDTLKETQIDKILRR